MTNKCLVILSSWNSGFEEQIYIDVECGDASVKLYAGAGWATDGVGFSNKDDHVQRVISFYYDLSQRVRSVNQR